MLHMQSHQSFGPKKTHCFILFLVLLCLKVLTMSCGGCRVLRKGCSENCMLRQSLQCIESPQAQAHATVFVAKFFGRAGLMSFLSSVPHPQRPALFQSLLFEGVGRMVNPVSGAVGLMCSGNWNVCQSAVQVVLRGGTLQPLPVFVGEVSGSDFEDVSNTAGDGRQCFLNPNKRGAFCEKEWF